ncbi:SOS response-associated peptidase [Gloeothece verrucosa]|uniref:Abasic site processing protein n=1 Tax=Gloeothece verrucosa (strain PCC 7822) TaxID=497965 RepID=E0UG93_GLOV7|nr:SOS response-associated peptidase [Gloeothece verrucosa]ADN16712.1 protein of unknown function DUF159 [Gloeothece verrucosa PCC 7822]
MCGRFTLTHSAATIGDNFNLPLALELNPRYNLAPTQPVLTMVQELNSPREWKKMRWGLIPSWAKDLKIGNRLINARAETVSEKPSFKSAFKHRRCLIIADGFYEWKKEGASKQPYYFQTLEAQPFAFAGLWETWKSPAAELIISCTIITTTANDLVQPIHERMPVILPKKSYDQWLDPTLTDLEELQSVLKPFSSQEMKAAPVSNLVNNPSFDNKDCIQTIAL